MIAPEKTNRDTSSEQRSSGIPMNILLAYDGSSHAQAAVDLLCDLPLSGSNLTALGVMPTQYFGEHEALKANLEEQAQRLSNVHMQVSSEMKAGNPAATINEYAREQDSNLIVIGAKGLRATLGILLGGVAQQVVEYSHCPVLVVRAPYAGLKRVLVVTDGSEHSQEALDYLAPLCDPGDYKANPDVDRQRCFWLPEHVKMRIMHVLPPPISPETAARAWMVGPEVLYPAPAPPIDKEAIEKQEKQEGERFLAEAQAILEVAGIAAETVLLRGDAATEIIEYVKENQIDLIVCGSRGLSRVAGWLLGSVSRKLVHYAGCSVLIVKSDQEGDR